MPDPQPQQLTVQQAMQLAIQHHQAGHFQQAEAICRQVLAVQPHQPDALHVLGVLALGAERRDIAIDLIGRAIAINPACPDYYSSLGQVLAQTDQLDQAIACYQKAIAIDPGLAQAHNNLGNAMIELGQIGPAVASLRRALELEPDSSMIQHNLAGALYAAGDGEAAVAAFRRAIQLQPNFAPSHSGLGVALQFACGQLREAEEAYQQALLLDPQFPEAHYHLGMAHLLRGDLKRGWPEYEWRLKVKSLNLIRHSFKQPRWDGSDPAGKRILLIHEQGFGDTIQFARYALLLQERGARVILQCQPELVGLLRSMSENIQMISAADPIPEFDVYSPLLSLPMAFKTELNSIPAAVPYLHEEANRSELWRERIKSEQHVLKVGIAWAGSRQHKNDRNRSIALAMFAPLIHVQDVTFYSLQNGEASWEAANSSLIDFSTELRDFTDTAALIDHLDLIITVDTAIAHLAGAMGKPTWVLLPFMPDWRWMLNRHDSPWYPTTRLFRQTELGQWQSPIEQAVAALRSFKTTMK